MSVDVENEIKRQAAERGLDPDNSVNRLLIEAAASSPRPAPVIIRSVLTPEELLQSSQELAEREKARNLPVAPSDFRREDIYEQGQRA